MSENPEQDEHAITFAEIERPWILPDDPLGEIQAGERIGAVESGHSAPYQDWEDFQLSRGDRVGVQLPDGTIQVHEVVEHRQIRPGEWTITVGEAHHAR